MRHLKTQLSYGATLAGMVVTLLASQTQAGDPDTMRPLAPKKGLTIRKPVKTTGSPIRAGQKRETRRHDEVDTDAGVEPLATESAESESHGVGASQSQRVGPAVEHSPTTAHSLAPVTPADVEPAPSAVAGLQQVATQSNSDLTVLALVLLATAGVVLASYALYQLRHLRRLLRVEAGLLRGQLERLARELNGVQRVAQRLVPRGDEAASRRARPTAPPTVTPTPAAEAEALPVCSSDDIVFDLLRALLAALRQHGRDTASGTQLQVDVRKIERPHTAPASNTALCAALSKLNLAPGAASFKALRDQNFLSIAMCRSDADNVPRQMVRVHKDAVPALEALATHHAPTADVTTR